jgi:hypothetical protein
MKLVVPGALLGLSLTLGMAGVYELAAPLDPVNVEKPDLAAHRMPVAPPASFVPPAEDRFADINNRPLFIASRKPLADIVQANAATTATSDFSLVGVIMGGARAIALIHSKSASSTTSAALGDAVNGWRVARIDATTVTLRAGGNDFVLPLNGPTSGPPSAPLPPLGAVPQTTSPASTPATTAAATPALAAGTPPPTAATPPIKISPTTATASVTPPKPATPANAGEGTITPEALRGAPIDPATGQPTL